MVAYLRRIDGDHNVDFVYEIWKSEIEKVRHTCTNRALQCNTTDSVMYLKLRKRRAVSKTSKHLCMS